MVPGDELPGDELNKLLRKSFRFCARIEWATELILTLKGEVKEPREDKTKELKEWEETTHDEQATDSEKVDGSYQAGLKTRLHTAGSEEGLFV